MVIEEDGGGMSEWVGRESTDDTIGLQHLGVLLSILI
jgi:hypothetical protein